MMQSAQEVVRHKDPRPAPPLPNIDLMFGMRVRLDKIEECLSAISLLNDARQHSSGIDLPFPAVGTRNVGIDNRLIRHALYDRRIDKTLVGKPLPRLCGKSGDSHQPRSFRAAVGGWDISRFSPQLAS